MSDTYIKVDNLSKLYRLGQAEARHDSLGGAVASMLKAPFQNFRKLKSLSEFKDKEDSSVLWALKDVSFKVGEGEVLGIVGRNGAGKSTLLKLLSRITLPSSGSIEIGGRVVSLLEVGTGFHKELSGRENVYMNGTILGMTRKEIDRKFDEIVAFSGVERFIDTPVKRYSSGMQVRLAFAVAAHLEPEIMIIDEVLAVGDADFQKRCLGKMKDVSQQGRTVLFVSHNLLAVQALCSRAILMRNGRNISDGLPAQIISEYLNLQGAELKNLNFDFTDAPGNDGARLLKAEVVPMSDGDKIYAHDPIKFRFEFYKLETQPAHMSATFHLMDEMGNLVFVGTSVAEKDGEMLGAGYFTAECTIPANLMLEGNYTITRLLFVKNGGSVIYEHADALSFEIAEKPLYAFGWMGGKEGVVGPKLDWKVEFDERDPS